MKAIGSNPIFSMFPKSVGFSCYWHTEYASDDLEEIRVAELMNHMDDLLTFEKKKAHDLEIMRAEYLDTLWDLICSEDPMRKAVLQTRLEYCRGAIALIHSQVPPVPSDLLVRP